MTRISKENPWAIKKPHFVLGLYTKPEAPIRNLRSLLCDALEMIMTYISPVSTFEAQSDYWQTRQGVFDVASLLNNQRQGRGFRKYSITIHVQIIDNR